MAMTLVSHCHSGVDKAEARNPYSARFGSRTSAAALSGMTVVLGSCGWLAQDSCVDDGGVWDGNTEECFCTYSQFGTYEDEPSSTQLQWRDWCADKSNLESIRNAETPAPKGD